MTQRSSLLRAAGSVSLATLVSRVLGLVRDQAQSYFFGAGMVTDAFLAAYRIPNLLRDLFAEGALSSAFVPTFTAEMERRGEPGAWRLANRVAGALLVVLGVLTVLILVFAPQILHVYVSGFDPPKMELAVSMTRILAPFLLCIALAAVAMGMLNTLGRFFLPALAPASFNVAAILGMVLLIPVFRAAGLHPGLALATGAMAGGVLQFLVQVPALHGKGYRFRPAVKPSDPGVRRVGRLMLPATFGLAATQINIFVDTVLASRLGDGPITWLQLAFRLMFLPIGLFGVAIATANLAHVSRDAATGNRERLRGNLATSLRAAAILTLPASAGLIALRVPTVRLLFEHGRFTPESTAKTAAAVLCYALGLYAYSVVKIQVPTFYALGDTRRPVVASATAVAVKITANFLFLWLFAKLGMDRFLGLALSTSLAAWTNLGLLSHGLRRHLGSLAGRGVLSTTLKMVVVAGAMGAACLHLHAQLALRLPGGGVPGEAARLLAVVAVGVALAGAMGAAAGVSEIRRAAGGLLRAGAARSPWNRS